MLLNASCDRIIVVDQMSPVSLMARAFCAGAKVAKKTGAGGQCYCAPTNDQTVGTILACSEGLGALGALHSKGRIVGEPLS
jgi:hypothetical protein